jgi:signal transduction histidine kinase
MPTAIDSGGGPARSAAGLAAHNSGLPSIPAAIVDAPVRVAPRLMVASAAFASLLAALVWRLSAPSAVTVSVGGCVLAAGVVAALWLRRVVKRDYVDPLRLSLQGLDALRRGDAGRRLPEEGAPIARALARSLNLASAQIDERFRRSQANLMSVEIAFDRIHSVLQSLKEGVIVIDVLGEVVLANRVARRLLKDDGRPLEGRKLLSLTSGVIGEQIAIGLARIEAGNRSRVQLMGLQDGERMYDVYVVPVESNRPDQDFGTVIVVADVTANHEIARLKDEFLSSVSHELRTPLTNICAFAEILGQIGPDHEADWREFVGIMTQESQRLRGLVDDLLSYTRLETGQVEWDLQPVDVGEVAAAASDLFRGAAARRGIGLQTVIDAQACLLALGEREALNQVMARLIDNAIKFTPAGGTIRVTVGALPVGIEVAVEDSGRGVPVQHRETVFDKFSQIGDPLTGKPAGAGLGLPICRRIIDRMGGAIWCEESVLGGAQFRFLLPPAMPAAAEVRPAGAARAE